MKEIIIIEISIQSDSIIIYDFCQAILATFRILLTLAAMLSLD